MEIRRWYHQRCYCCGPEEGDCSIACNAYRLVGLSQSRCWHCQRLGRMMDEGGIILSARMLLKVYFI